MDLFTYFKKMASEDDYVSQKVQSINANFNTFIKKRRYEIEILRKTKDNLIRSVLSKIDINSSNINEYCPEQSLFRKLDKMQINLETSREKEKELYEKLYYAERALKEEKRKTQSLEKQLKRERIEKEMLKKELIEKIKQSLNAL